MAHGKAQFCHVCKTPGHSASIHYPKVDKNRVNATHESGEGFVAKSFHGSAEGSIYDGTLRRKKVF